MKPWWRRWCRSYPFSGVLTSQVLSAFCPWTSGCQKLDPPASAQLTRAPSGWVSRGKGVENTWQLHVPFFPQDHLPSSPGCLRCFPLIFFSKQLFLEYFIHFFIDPLSGTASLSQIFCRSRSSSHLSKNWSWGKPEQWNFHQVKCHKLLRGRASTGICNPWFLVKYKGQGAWLLGHRYAHVVVVAGTTHFSPWPQL